MVGVTSTADRLLETGTRMLLQHGYRGTGLQDLLAASGVPKGSFYHHFDSKAAFVVAAIERYFAEQGRVLAAAVADPSGATPIERLRGYFTGLADGYEEAGWTTGCLLGTLGQELAASEEPVRERVAACFETWRNALADVLRTAQERGQIAAAGDVEALAGFLVDSWEGAVLQAKVQRSRAPLTRWDASVFDDLLQDGKTRRTHVR
jgi:TetR/AcrR family transcriptional repressor of nem operon